MFVGLERYPHGNPGSIRYPHGNPGSIRYAGTRKTFAAHPRELSSNARNSAKQGGMDGCVVGEYYRGGVSSVYLPLAMMGVRHNQMCQTAIGTPKRSMFQLKTLWSRSPVAPACSRSNLCGPSLSKRNRQTSAPHPSVGSPPKACEAFGKWRQRTAEKARPTTCTLLLRQCYVNRPGRCRGPVGGLPCHLPLQAESEGWYSL